MIPPKNNRIIQWFFRNYVHWITRRNFHTINFNTVAIDQNRSVLLLANHFSIWDGLLLYWLNSKLLKKKFHVMILEETSKKEPFLRYGGAFSVNKKSKDILESLDFAARLLKDPQNLVLIFPQGKLYSNFVTDLSFENGILKVIKQASDNFQIIFAATFVESFKYKKPTASVYLSRVESDFTGMDELKEAYQQHYNAARLLQTQIVL